MSGKRILVVYFSLSGNTTRVARELAMRLDADLEQIRESVQRRGLFGYLRAVWDALRANPVQLIHTPANAGDYALTLVGTPIWAGRITPAARAYLASIRDQVHDIAFFTTSGSTPVETVVRAVESLVGRRPVAYFGLTARELRDPAVQKKKMKDFAALLRARTLPHDVPRELERVRA
ncbi:MAG TPA: hypothetical protein VFP37_06995 [Steroidobacteraceae bacterium]|nr:hypothetical protein [Steroidobacteraceae bacterium]